MSKPISITDECNEMLENDCVKDENKKRTETYSEQIIRHLKKAN